MEKFTNDVFQLYEQAKKELYHIDLHQADEEVVVTFGVFPHFHNEFVIFALLDSNGHYRLLKKEWDKGYDSSRFRLGIYNLDRLRIQDFYYELTEAENNVLKSLILRLTTDNLPDAFEDEGIIVLDGVAYELTFRTPIGKKCYRWHVPNQNIRLIEGLLDFLLKYTKSNHQ